MKKTKLNLVPNWKVVKIPEVLFFQEGPGVRKWQFTNQGVKLLNVGNINNGKLNLSTTKLFLSRDEAFGKYAHFLVDDGDLLIACSGIVLENFHNKIAFVSESDLPLCLNTSTMRFKAIDESQIDLNFFKYFLQTNHFNKQLRTLITGSAQLNFGPSHIKKIDLYLPSIAEQQKIAEILDAADALRQKDQQLIDHYTALSQSLFLDMFGDLFVNTKKFPKHNFEEISERVQIGPFGSQLHKHDYVENGVPLVNPIHIVNSEIVPNLSFSLLSEKYESLPNYHLKTGDVVMGRRGEMGRCALVTEKENGYFCGTGSLFIRPSLKVNSVFLLHVITSKGGKSYLENNAQGVTMMNLNKKIILNAEIGLPPLPLQEKFEEAISNIKKQKQQAEASLAQSNNLFNSLLQKAFTGELTQQSERAA